MVAVSLFFGFRMTARAGAKKAPVEKQPLRFQFNPGAFFTLFILSLFVIGLYSSADWRIQARLFPWVIGIPGLAMCVMQLFGDFFRRRDASEQGFHGAMDLPVDQSVPVAVVVKRAVNSFGWVLGLFATIWIIGFVVAVPLFIFLYLTFQAREKLWISSAYCVGMLAFIVGVFHLILNAPWPEGLLPHAEEWILRRVESFM
jgi:MFS family permease